MRKKLCSASLIKLGLVTLISIGFIDLSLADEKSSSNIVTEYYWVKDGKVDASTFIGWSLFHNTCVGCHGVGGIGTELAPDLTQSISGLSPAEFTTKVFHRYSMPVGDRTNMTNAIMAKFGKTKCGIVESWRGCQNGRIIHWSGHMYLIYMVTESPSRRCHRSR